MEKTLDRLTLKLDHLFRLTDNVGIIEHSLLATPNKRHGYTTDDNARALQVCLRLSKKYSVLKKLTITYFKFLISSRNEKGFYNDLSYNLRWQKCHSPLGEHFGRAMNALAETAADDTNENRKKMAVKIFDQMINLINPTLSLRTVANLINALYHRQRINSKSPVIKDKTKQLADFLLKKKQDSSDKNWCWFENVLSYDNSRLPLGLIYAYKVLGEKQYLTTALQTLDFLLEITFDKQKDCFSFPGNKGWFTKEGKRALYGQQSIEPGSTVEVCCSAYEATQKRKYYRFAEMAFAWYYGKNISNQSLVNEETGGIKDGIDPTGVNQNQGSESVLSYLTAYHSLIKIEK